jgi:hypothetical protein
MAVPAMVMIFISFPSIILQYKLPSLLRREGPGVSSSIAVSAIVYI